VSAPVETIGVETVGALPPVRHATVGGRRLAYREAGLGPPLLLLHGVGSGAGSWLAQLASLATRRRVIAWDAPGYGESDRLPDPAPGAADYAAAALGLADVLRLERFILLGHSLGAIMAAALCARHAARIERLILSAPAAGYGKAPADERAARIGPRLREMARLGPVGLAEQRARNLLAPNASAEAIAHVRAVMSQLRPDGYEQACRLLGQADIFEDLGAIAVPTLVMCGDADAVTPEDGCRRIAAAIPGARYETLRGVGHASYIEDPAQYDAALLRFLEAAA
jgi:pimeloyl-ACP methyl ester carboxylesterase